MPRAFHLEGFRLQGASPAAQNGCPDLLNVRIGWAGHGVPPQCNRVLGIGYWENTTGVIARAKPVAIYDFLAIAFVFLSQDVFGLINSLFRWSVYRVALDCTREK
jgi:hypothetical protein